MTPKGRRMLRNISATARLFQQIPWHNPKAKPTELNKDFKSQPPPREEAPCAHVRRASTPTKSKNMGQLHFLKCFSPLLMNTIQVRKRHIDRGYPLDSKMGRQPMLTPKMQQHLEKKDTSFSSKTRPICKTPFNRPETPTTLPPTGRRDKKDVTYYRSSC